MSKESSAEAVVFSGPGKVRVEEVELPRMSDADLLVEVEYSAISAGTERWCLTGRLNVPGQPPLAFPHVPGYQAAGVVARTGRDVKGLREGDRVFSRNCKPPEGYPGSWWGGHVRRHVADGRDVVKLPETVSTREASSLLLAQVGYNGASKPRVEPGDVALVIGEGLVGQFAAQALRARGAYVIISGLVESRLKIARAHSADEVFDAARGDLASYIREKHPKGVAVAVETASSGATVRLAIDLLSHGGQLVMNGFYPPSESSLDWHWLRTKELALYCPNSRTRPRLEAALGLIERGKMKVEELVTHELPYTEAPEAYRMLLGPAADFLGVVFRWT